MGTVGIIDDPECPRENGNLEILSIMEFAVGMVGYFTREFKTQVVGLVVINPMVENVCPLGNHHEQFESLEKVQFTDTAHIKLAVVRDGTRREVKSPCKTSPDGNRIDKALRGPRVAVRFHDYLLFPVK